MKKGMGMCAIALALALACGGGGGADVGRGEGIVRAVDPVANKVTLDHGTIPGMMEAMRMDFAVADAALLDGLAPGDRVQIAIRKDGEVYTLTEVVEVPAQ
jgi:Cu/Ag efflux protein CusF